MVDSTQYKALMGSWATGVCIITTYSLSLEQAVGFTANSLAALSLQPPLVMFGLAHDAEASTAFYACSHFGINILTTQQQALANHFATKDSNKFANISYQTDQNGAPLLTHCLATASCQVTKRSDEGDHLLMIGQVLETEVHGGNPLLYCKGAYQCLETITET